MDYNSYTFKNKVVDKLNDDDDKKKKKKKKTTKAKMSDLTPEQQKKINSLNLKKSAKDKAITAFDKMNNNG